MNQKGHALIELVIILPILLFLVLAGYDFYHIKETEKKLEKQLIELEKNWNVEKTFDDLNQWIKEKNENISLEIKNSNDEYFVLILKEEIKIRCPILNRILKNPYIVEISKKEEKRESYD